MSKNVARLEAGLGVRLFQRSTRKLTLTESGERLLQQIGGALGTLADAVAGAAEAGGQPAGTLKVSMGQAFGRTYVVPLVGEFLARYPAVVPDWHFDNRQVDLIGEGFDAAIGGGIELTPGVVARELARIHIVAVAAPAYLAGKPMPQAPVATWPPSTPSCGAPRPPGACAPGRCATPPATKARPMRSRASIFSDPEAIAPRRAMGLGIALAADGLRAARACRAARWCACCRAGMPTRGRSRSTTRARSCCRRRRACSSTSWSRSFASSALRERMLRRSERRRARGYSPATRPRASPVKSAPCINRKHA